MESIDQLKELYTDAGLAPELVERMALVDAGHFENTPFVPVAGGDAFDAWLKFRNAHDCSGRFPTLVTSGSLNGWFKEVLFSDSESEEIIAAAVKLADDPEWRFHVMERFDDLHRWGSWEAKAHELVDRRGRWPSGIKPHHDFYMPRFLSDYGLCLLLPKCKEPWMMPAYLDIGYSNDQPDCINRCAMLRRWYLRWGAEPFFCSGSTLEVYVERPPTDRESALALAFEHIWLCYDRIDQASPEVHRIPSGTVEGLASILIDSSAWYFWWD